MPIYPEIKTYEAGFYNNSDKLPRVYNAEDVRKPYDTVFSDGIMPDADGTAGTTLQVTATGGMGISVAAGHAKLGGAWFENRSAYNIILDASTGSIRYDCVIIRNDDTESVKEPSIYIKSLNRVPTINDLTRDGYIYEVCVAYIKVAALATGISDADITDTRTDGSLCRTMSGVGAMVVRTYRSSYVSATLNQTIIPIDIPQYNKSNDTLIVAVEGRIFTEGTNYTIESNSAIKLAIGLPVVGTKVDFEVTKNVNANGAETVVQEVAQLTNDVQILNNKMKYDYLCNGVNDNINISNIIADFLSSSTIQDDAQLYLNIHGTFGASNKYMSDNWIICGGVDSEETKRVILDFKNCSKMHITLSGNTNNNIFYGVKYEVRNLNLDVVGLESGCNVSIHGSLVGEIKSENCRVELITTGYAVYARNGTHINNDVMCSSTENYASCFYQGGYYNAIKVIGGKYRAYTATSSAHSEVFYTENAASNAVHVAVGVSCPTVARTNFIQKHSINTNSGYITAIGLISALTINTTGATASITGTIPISKT